MLSLTLELSSSLNRTFLFFLSFSFLPCSFLFFSLFLFSFFFYEYANSSNVAWHSHHVLSVAFRNIALREHRPLKVVLVTPISFAVFVRLQTGTACTLELFRSLGFLFNFLSASRVFSNPAKISYLLFPIQSRKRE